MTGFKALWCTSALLLVSGGVFAAPQTLAARLQAQISELASEVDHMKAKVTDLSDQLDAQKRLNDKIAEDLRIRTEMLEKKGGSPAKRKAAPVDDEQDDVYPPKKKADDFFKPLGDAPKTQAGHKGGYDPNPSHVLGALGSSDDLMSPPKDEIIYRDAYSEMKTLAPLPSIKSAAEDEEEGHEVKPKPQDFLAEAREKMGEQDFEGARALFQKFIKGDAKSPKLPDARFGVGESYFAEKSYGAAAKAYLEGYQKHKTSSKGPDFLFKLGSSLERLGKKPEACKSYEKMLKEYPKASDSLKKRASDAQKKACALPKAE